MSFLSQTFELFDLFFHTKYFSVSFAFWRRATSFCTMTTSYISIYGCIHEDVVISERLMFRLINNCPSPLQVAVTIGLQYVNTSLSTLANPEDPESESEGWILEKTVGETFTDIMDKMKAMGKGSKVEEGAEAPVATVS